MYGLLPTSDAEVIPNEFDKPVSTDVVWLLTRPVAVKPGLDGDEP